jgi:hypothetical protein
MKKLKKLRTPSDREIQIKILMLNKHRYEQIVQVQALAEHPEIVGAPTVL